MKRVVGKSRSFGGTIKSFVIDLRSQLSIMRQTDSGYSLGALSFLNYQCSDSRVLILVMQ